jgi:hypothetical protein
MGRSSTKMNWMICWSQYVPEFSLVTNLCHLRCKFNFTTQQVFGRIANNKNRVTIQICTSELCFMRDRLKICRFNYSIILGRLKLQRGRYMAFLINYKTWSVITWLSIRTLKWVTKYSFSCIVIIHDAVKWTRFTLTQSTGCISSSCI